MVIRATGSVAIALDWSATAGDRIERRDCAATKILVSRAHTSVHDIDVRAPPSESGARLADAIEVPQVL